MPDTFTNAIAISPKFYNIDIVINIPIFQFNKLKVNLRANHLFKRIYLNNRK